MCTFLPTDNFLSQRSGKSLFQIRIRYSSSTCAVQETVSFLEALYAWQWKVGRRVLNVSIGRQRLSPFFVIFRPKFTTCFLSFRAPRNWLSDLINNCSPLVFMPKRSWEAKSYLLRFFFLVINEINSSQIFWDACRLRRPWQPRGDFWIITTTDFCEGSCGKVGDGKTAEEKLEAEMRPLRTTELDKHSERGFILFWDDPKKPNMCCVGKDNSQVDLVYLGTLQLVLSSKHLMNCHTCNYCLGLWSFCKNFF